MQIMGVAAPKEKDVIWKMTRRGRTRREWNVQEREVRGFKLLKLPDRVGNPKYRQTSHPHPPAHPDFIWWDSCLWMCLGATSRTFCEVSAWRPRGAGCNLTDGVTGQKGIDMTGLVKPGVYLVLRQYNYLPG